MKTSLNNLREVEKYVEGSMSLSEKALFEVRMNREPLLRLDVKVHYKVIAMLKMYHRKKLKEEVENVHQRLFAEPLKSSFRQRVLELFVK